jgi:hypothetical protein
MAATAATIPLDIDFSNRLASLRAVGTIVNANLTYWGAPVSGVPVVPVPAQTTANSQRRWTRQLNDLINSVAGAYTGLGMTPPSAAMKTYVSTDYHDFQSILSAIIAQHNAIVTAHP